jgi:hypothetical protein
MIVNAQAAMPTQCSSPSIFVPSTPTPNGDFALIPSISTPQSTSVSPYIDQTSNQDSESECYPFPHPPLLPSRKPFGCSKDDIHSNSSRKRPNSVQLQTFLGAFGKRCKKENWSLGMMMSAEFDFRGFPFWGGGVWIYFMIIPHHS